jgi:hypothetical protein
MSPKGVSVIDEQTSKRELLKKAAYIALAILILKAVPSFASNGSALTEQAREKDKQKGNNGVGNGIDPQPPGNPPVNDGPGTSPGNPGNKQKNH